MQDVLVGKAYGRLGLGHYQLLATVPGDVAARPPISLNVGSREFSQ